jgi:hypothetical protein
MLSLLLLLASTVLAPAPNSSEEPRLIIATVGHSEWCPPGDVNLDLKTGRYFLVPRGPRESCNERDHPRAARQGVLRGEALERIRSASLRVDAVGALNPDCRDGGKPRDLVTSNGGTPRLALSTAAAVIRAPDDLSCWSGAVNQLHRILEDVFGQ